MLARLGQLRAHDLLNRARSWTSAISACTITMDHKAIICSMIDRLAQGQIKMFTSGVGSQKYLLGCRTHIFVIDYQWGSMESDETASTIPGGLRWWRFTGDGAPSGPCTLFRGQNGGKPGGLEVGPGVGKRPAPPPSMRQLGSQMNHCQAMVK